MRIVVNNLPNHPDVRTGIYVTEQVGHVVNAKGGITLPVDPTLGENGVARFSKIHYDPNTIPRSANWTLPGPLISLVGKAVRIHFALHFEVHGDPKGIVAVVPSGGQFGTGMVRVAPLESRSWRIETIERGTSTLFGSFHIHPPTSGFAAYDFAVSHPEGVRPRWAAMTQTMGR